VRHFRDLQELQVALRNFQDRYNGEWLIEMFSFKSPRQARERLLARHDYGELTIQEIGGGTVPGVGLGENGMEREVLKVRERGGPPGVPSQGAMGTLANAANPSGLPQFGSGCKGTGGDLFPGPAEEERNRELCANGFEAGPGGGFPGGGEEGEDDAARFAVALDFLAPTHARFEVGFVPPHAEAHGDEALVQVGSGLVVLGAIAQKAVVGFEGGLHSDHLCKGMRAFAGGELGVARIAVGGSALAGSLVIGRYLSFGMDGGLSEGFQAVVEVLVEFNRTGVVGAKGSESRLVGTPGEREGVEEVASMEMQTCEVVEESEGVGVFWAEDAFVGVEGAVGKGLGCVVVSSGLEGAGEVIEQGEGVGVF